MTTSHGSILLPHAPAQSRGALRLRMSEHPGTDSLDGGWWPQSRDLAVELADLVDHFPTRYGRMVRALSMLHVLVVQPGFSDDQGAEALLAAATLGNAHTAQDLLDTVTEHADIDPRNHWSDDGGSWLRPRLTAPTPRTGR
jgi:hypothetical protein